MSAITAQQFSEALQSIGMPQGRQLDFLRAHARAKSRAATFSQLAEKAGYASYRAINLHYGKLAQRIGMALGIPQAGISLLMESRHPDSVTNREWVLVMRPEFAAALQAEGWL